MADDLRPTQTQSESSIESAMRWISDRPLVHFVFSEFMSALASFSVYVLILMFSYAAQEVTALLPLNNPAPLQFLDLVLAWGTAFGGGVTFAMLTIFNVLRLGLQLTRQVRA